jgi:hypothetical protein
MSDPLQQQTSLLISLSRSLFRDGRRRYTGLAVGAFNQRVDAPRMLEFFVATRLWGTPFKNNMFVVF